MATIEKALQTAAGAHAGQTDRQGEPYILHPLRVMMSVEDPDAQIVAILHDVVEDTQVTFDDLREAGFSERILAALQLMTHQADQTYAEYVVACKPNSLARQVKLADLQDNASVSRVMLRPEKLQSDSKRMHRYALSYRYLVDGIDEATYRRLMVNYEK